MGRSNHFQESSIFSPILLSSFEESLSRLEGGLGLVIRQTFNIPKIFKFFSKCANCWEEDDVEKTEAMTPCYQFAAMDSVPVPIRNFSNMIPLRFQRCSSFAFKCADEQILNRRMKEMILRKLGQ